NGLRVKAPLKSLVKTDPPKKSSIPKTTFNSTTHTPDLTVKTSLDLRGFRGDDAIRECTYYLDKALARGLKQVEIIHGKGEGILQKLIHETLQKRDEVQTFDIAPWESGGSGCTIVTFR
ncbi:MAG: endonuclease MutS2, partial [Balneolaceae bacterium]